MKVIFSFILFFGLTTFSNQKIKLVTDPWCPFACKQGGHPGYMVEIAQKIYQKLGYRVEYKTIPFARAIFEVETGTSTAVVGIQKSEKRKSFIFPKEELGKTKSCFYTNNDSTLNYADAGSLHGKRVGVIVGYLYGNEIDVALKNPSVTKEERSGEDALKANISMLQAKRLDFVVEYETVMSYFLKNNPKIQIKNVGCAQSFSDFYIAFSPKNQNSIKFAEELSNGLIILRKNGELKKILSEYGLVDWK